MSVKYFIYAISGMLSAFLIFAHPVCAGGVGLGTTRLIYSASAKQISVPVRNTDASSAFLLQSWIETANGEKTDDFLITPPLSVIKPKHENVLRIIQTGATLPADRESVYWLTVKAIPAIYEKKNSNDNVLQLASASRIKLFWRPDNLGIKPETAPSMLSASRKDGGVLLSNASPYYLSLVNIKSGSRTLSPLMVPPKGSIMLNTLSGNTLSLQTINDYGARTKTQVLTW